MTQDFITPKINISFTGAFQYAYFRMFFNSQLCEVTIADKAGYFDNKNITYQIWDTYATLTASGDGMKDVERFNCDELLIVTPFGNFKVRKITDGDKKIYGCNNFKGLFLEPIKE